jgi:transposase
MGRNLQLWKAYIQLTQAEAAFRIHKDQLQVRPIWHQREDRVQAHILVCFLAFVLWKSLEMWQQRAGLGNVSRDNLDENGASIWMRRGGRAERQLTMAVVLARL